MDAYSRYPNRARPAAEPPRFGYKFDKSDAENSRDKFAAPDRQEPSGEKTEPGGEKQTKQSCTTAATRSLSRCRRVPRKITDTEPQIASGVSTDTKKKKAASKAKAPRHNALSHSTMNRRRNRFRNSSRSQPWFMSRRSRALEFCWDW